MNIYLSLGILVLIAYVVGRIFGRLGFPKIIGYILTGIVFSPNTFDWIPQTMIDQTDALLTICLSFIAFEVGGELRWSAIKKQENVIVGVTVMASFIPFLLITGGFYLLHILAPGTIPLQNPGIVLVFAILLASLASPTDPTATLAVIHEYNARGKVKNTIVGVAALDDALGVLLFSISVSLGLYLIGSSSAFGAALLEALLHIGGAVVTGIVAAGLMNLFIRFLKDENEGQWIIIIFSLIALCYGVATFLNLDELLACLVMGAVVANRSEHRKIVFNTLERYTEELIFLFFFVLSGLQLEIQSIPAALLPILVFVILRTTGKFAGAYLGAAMAGADAEVRKYTVGGLLPQGGIVIGLALILNRYEAFSGIFDLLLAVVMGATIIHELTGPILAKQSLIKAGEIQLKKDIDKNKISRVTRSKSEARATYNRLSKVYDKLIHPFEKKEKQHGLALLNAQPGETILEIGFGTGNNLVELAKAVGKDGKIFGIDIAERMLEVTRQRLEKARLEERAELKRGDAVQLPYEDNSFDAVFMSFVLDLFDNPDIPKVLEECQRVLKPEGRLVNVSLQKADTLSNNIYETVHEAFPKTVDCRPIPADALLEEAGFTVEEKKDLSMFGLKVSCILASVV